MDINPQERDEYGIAAAALIDALFDALVRTNRMSKDDIGNILAKANETLSKDVAHGAVRGASRVIDQMVLARK